MSHTDVYAKRLRFLGHGLPLWHPEPADAGEVQVGDVGLIRDGGFQRLFNIVVTADHAYNRDGVPIDFVPFSFSPALLRICDSYLNPGIYSSRNVKIERLLAEGSQMPMDVSRAGFRVESMQGSGAFLVLGSNARQEVLIPNEPLRAYMRRHQQRWYEYAVARGAACTLEDIILIRGVVKTSPDWTLATLTRIDPKQQSARASPIISNPSQDQFPFQPHPSTSILSRSGVVLKVNDMHEQRPDGSPADAVKTRDQCIFVVALTVKTQQKKLVKPSFKVYQRKLAELGHGIPLWYPDYLRPGFAQDEVTLGDVGVIHDGAFHRLFNFTVEATHPWNRFGVPDAFEPYRMSTIQLSELSAGVYSNKGADIRILDMSSREGVTFGLPSYEVTCGKNSALLLLPQAAKSEVLVPSKVLRYYIGQHRAAWYSFVAKRLGMIVKPEDLIVVQGFVKASRWTVAAFVKHGNAGYINGTFVPSSPQGDFVWVDRDRRDMSIEYRSGPQSAGPQLSTDSRIADQCVFLAQIAYESSNWNPIKAVGRTFKTLSIVRFQDSAQQLQRRAAQPSRRNSYAPQQRGLGPYSGSTATIVTTTGTYNSTTVYRSSRPTSRSAATFPTDFDNEAERGRKHPVWGLFRSLRRSRSLSRLQPAVSAPILHARWGSGDLLGDPLSRQSTGGSSWTDTSGRPGIRIRNWTPILDWSPPQETHEIMARRAQRMADIRRSASENLGIPSGETTLQVPISSELRNPVAASDIWQHADVSSEAVNKLANTIKTKRRDVWMKYIIKLILFPDETHEYPTEIGHVAEALVPPTPDDVQGNTSLYNLHQAYEPSTAYAAADQYITIEDMETFASDADSGVLRLLQLALSKNNAYEQIIAMAQLDASSSSSLSDLILQKMQEVLDIMNEQRSVMDAYDDGMVRQWSSLRGTLLKLCKALRRVPPSLFLANINCPDHEHPLDGGSFSDIFHAVHEGREVALKRLRVFKSDIAAGKNTMKTSFYQEAIVWRQLQHPNILPLLGLDQDTFTNVEMICMVSPWMPHGNINHCAQSLINENQAVPFKRWVHEIACGLRYLHDEGLVHGDLRGANIFVDQGYRIRIADFGLTRHADLTGTRTPCLPGASRWVAPEILSGLQPSFAGDVYSFGCVCLEICSGRAPFPDLLEHQVITAKVTHRMSPKWPEIFDASLPEVQIREIVVPCWHWEAASRPRMDVLETTLAAFVNAA